MKKYIFNLSLPVSVLKENKRFIAYTPALDLSTSGKTYAEVKKHFSEAVKIFFDELVERGTLEETLSNLGWKQIQKKWQPPTVVSNELQSVSI
ncbi:MAG: hypothetical protein M1334_02170 [Patescibacteria group bacterium]|nr:hypothetical protein [Patescibacteria group bacterium]